MRKLQTRALIIFAVLCAAVIARASTLAVPPAPGAHISGFVQVRAGRELNVDYYAAEAGQPTLVMINGLTYDLTNFNPMIPHMLHHGYGILRYDPFGMGQTLVHYGAVTGPITVEEQVEDLQALLTVLHLPQVYVMGLSYGGGVELKFAATYPDSVKQLILMSAFVTPAGAPQSSQDLIVRNEIAATRMANPMNPETDDQLYEYFFHQLVYETYPTAEPEVMENPYKLEATFRLADGIRSYMTDDSIPYWPQHSIHMMVGAQDQYIPVQFPNIFWAHLQPGQRLSRININNSSHKMPEVIPTFASAWINEIMAGNPALQTGGIFAADALTGKVTGPAGFSKVLPADSAVMPH